MGKWKKSTPAEQGAQEAVRAVRLSYATLWLPAAVWVVLSRIIYLSALHALKRGRLTRSCIPSRRYFGGVTGLSNSTISRITTRLAKTGFISKFQRRPENDLWQTCQYRLEGVVWGKVLSVVAKIVNNINRVAFVRHIVSKDGVLHTSQRRIKEFSHKFRVKGGEDTDYEGKLAARLAAGEYSK